MYLLSDGRVFTKLVLRGDGWEVVADEDGVILELFDIEVDLKAVVDAFQGSLRIIHYIREMHWKCKIVKAIPQDLFSEGE